MPDNGTTNWPATDNLNLPADMDTRAPTSAGDGNYTFKQLLERIVGVLRAIVTDSRWTDSRAPNGSAGGDLTGTYPNPTVANLAITDAKVAAANKDGAAGTASMRTLGTGAAQAAAGNDTRITGAEQTSNKGTASGYAAASAGVLRKMKSGRYYRPNYVSGNVAPGQNYLFLSPLHIPEACTLDRIGVLVQATAASAVVRLGLYTSDANDQPSALLADFGATGPATTIDAHTATGALELTISQAVTPGLLWLAAVCQGGNPTLRVNNGLGALEVACTDLAQGLSDVPANGFYVGSITGALPNPFVATGSTGQATLVVVRVA